MPDNENKLYMLLGEMSADIKNILAKSNDQEDRLNAQCARIGKIEAFQWRLVGAATAASALVGIAIKFI